MLWVPKKALLHDAHVRGLADRATVIERLKSPALVSMKALQLGVYLRGREQVLEQSLVRMGAGSRVVEGKACSIPRLLSSAGPDIARGWPEARQLGQQLTGCVLGKTFCL